MLILNRLKESLTTFPSAGEWAFTLVILALYCLIALAINWRFKVFAFKPTNLPLPKAFLLVAIAIVTPSLLEESIYRGLLVPRASESMSFAVKQSWIAFSLLLYVGSHPLIAKLFWPWCKPIFYNPAFLLIVLVLGIACTTLYQFSQSLYPAVLIHWITIVAWKMIFGGPDFNLGKKEQNT